MTIIVRLHCTQCHVLLLQIRDKLSAIEAQHAELLETWERRREEFDHNLDVQTFHRDAEQAESWIALREAMLGNEEEDMGVINTTYLYMMYLQLVACISTNLVYSFLF